MQYYEYVLIALSVLNLGAMIFAIFKYFRDPDVKADKQLGINQVACEEKHKRVDEKFVDIFSELKLIKENHLSHIEKDLNELKVQFAEHRGEMNGKIDSIIKMMGKK